MNIFAVTQKMVTPSFLLADPVILEFSNNDVLILTLLSIYIAAFGHNPVYLFEEHLRPGTEISTEKR